MAGAEVPFGPDLIFRRDDVPGLKLHVEICEDMWVPVPPSAEAALAGATVLANLSGSPITVARAEDRRLLVRSRQRALQRGVPLRRRRARASRRPTCRGTARRWSTSAATCSPRPSGSPTAAQRSVADVDLDRHPAGAAAAGHLRRQPPHPRRPDRGVPDASSSSSSRPTGDIGLRRKVDRFPFVPDDPERLALDCYEAYNIQVSGLEQRLRAIGQPKVVIGVSRRPRLDPRPDRRGQGDGPARPPAQRHPRVHDAGLRDRRDHQVATPPGCPSRSA